MLFCEVLCGFGAGDGSVGGDCVRVRSERSARTGVSFSVVDVGVTRIAWYGRSGCCEMNDRSPCSCG